jgi:diadenosine tetraphosphatase ApaH/serine/threonine PP2A family protein phosphatase
VRIAVVSDIHANLVALEAVLKHAGEVDGVWCMGDSVGYGPQPAECVARLREVEALWVAGNHERAATGAMGVEEFNPTAAQAALWTRDQLSDAERAFLDALPETIVEADFTLVHGTLRYPVWEYLDDEDTALAHLSLQHTRYSFVGHTHVPAVVIEQPDAPRGCEMRRLKDGEAADLTGEERLVLNPGSVGQPRDGDRRASYGELDTAAGTFTLRRVEYDITKTQGLMSDVGLPAWLIERLDIGR